jgi:hypothetical protein
LAAKKKQAPKPEVKRPESKIEINTELANAGYNNENLLDKLLSESMAGSE